MYIVVELQKTGDQVGNFVYAYKNRNEAESRFYAVLSAAAVSEVPVHSAVLIDEQCNLYNSGVYEHPPKEGGSS